MPAAAVIPAPIAYIKVAAVKKLVVGFLVRCPWVADSFGFSCVPRFLRRPSFPERHFSRGSPSLGFL